MHIRGSLIDCRIEHRSGQPDPPDPKGLGPVEWMPGLGSGPIFGSALGSGQFRVQPDSTDLKKNKNKNKQQQQHN